MRSLNVIYCAGPYSGSTPGMVADNVADAVHFGKKVRALGALPLVPHVTVLSTDDYEGAMVECFELIRRSDAVVLMPTWHLSPGAVREKAFAEGLGLMVFESLEALAEAVAATQTMEVARAVAY